MDFLKIKLFIVPCYIALIYWCLSVLCFLVEDHYGQRVWIRVVSCIIPQFLNLESTKTCLLANRGSGTKYFDLQILFLSNFRFDFLKNN